MKLNDVFSGDSLKAADLQGREWNLTIKSYEVKEFDDGNKIVIHFQGAEKTLICNKTNANTIAGMYGDDLDGWSGKPITLFPTQTDFGGKQVPCIRVKIGPPAAQPQSPPSQPAADLDAPDLNDVPF